MRQFGGIQHSRYKMITRTAGSLAPSYADQFVTIGLSLRSGALSLLEQAANSDRMRRLRNDTR